MTPSESWTFLASAAGSPYECGRRQVPVHIIFAPSSLWRWWIAVRCAGSCGRPARRPSSTGCHGGRAVVVPIVASSVSFSRA